MEFLRIALNYLRLWILKGPLIMSIEKVPLTMEKNMDAKYLVNTMKLCLLKNAL